MNESHQDRLKVVLMRIIEGFSDYFVSRLEKSYHQSPTTIDVRNISVERKLGTTGIHIVKVQLESDLGLDEASIAVKIYDEQEQALDVVKRINIVKQRLSQKKYSPFGISSAAVIFFSRSVIVMEGIQGDVFRDSKIPRPQKYRYAGRSLAAFHGSESDHCWFDKYKLLLSRSLENLPTTREFKQSLSAMFADVVPLAEQASHLSGSISFGDFHPGNLIFDVRIGQKPMIITHLIDPEYLDTSTEHDRLEDICNFFAVEAVDQYRQDRELTKFRMNVKSFLSGYREVLAHEQTSFQNYYSGGNYIPVNFHLALMILMSIINIQDMEDLFGGERGIQNEVLLRCQLIEKLLNWNSFPD
ncbi:MAG: phosphotransferase [Candidatus Heimdallarchaeota archaeon]|nr:MAG: phosphotransferase [Candidatus Heimdallarchaeota archaeon]